MNNRLFQTLTIAFFLAVVLSASLWAGGEAELWDRWILSDESSEEVLDHGPWGDFLSKYRYVGENGVALIRYDEVSADDLRSLDTYVDYLQAVEVDTLNSREQYAFWVNLYNAATIQLILREYPVTSIRRISGARITSPGPWDLKLLQVAGEELSLDDIEHRILRPRWKDPRVHFVVNCASIGCPDVPPVPLTAENQDRLMEEGARIYLNHPRGIKADGRRLVISSIFDWFSVDFGENEADILDFIDEYRDVDQLLSGIGRSRENVAIRYDYDWSLNYE